MIVDCCLFQTFRTNIINCKNILPYLNALKANIMTVHTRSHLHSNTRRSTRCSLARPATHEKNQNHSLDQTQSYRRKGTPKKIPPRAKAEDGSCYLVRKNLFGGADSDPSDKSNPQKKKSKIIYNVAWRTFFGHIKLTDNNIIFKANGAGCKAKRVAWENVVHHEVRVMENPDTDEQTMNTRHLLKIKMKKEGSPSLILRFARQHDLDIMDHEITERLRARSIASFSRVYGTISAEPRVRPVETTYYPIVKLCGSIPGSLTLNSFEFVFEPLSQQNDLPTMQVRWARVKPEQVHFRHHQTALKITCRNSSRLQPPIVLQMASTTDLQRLHKDVTRRLEWSARNGASAVESPLMRSQKTLPTSLRSNKSEKPKKHVTFASPMYHSNDNDMDDSIPDLTETSSFDEPTTDKAASSSFFADGKNMVLSLFVLTLAVIAVKVWLVLEIAPTVDEIEVEAEISATPTVAFFRNDTAAPIMALETNEMVIRSIRALLFV